VHKFFFKNIQGAKIDNLGVCPDMNSIDFQAIAKITLSQFQYKRQKNCRFFAPIIVKNMAGVVTDFNTSV
jgi:hypothetical protein